MWKPVVIFVAACVLLMMGVNTQPTKDSNQVIQQFVQQVHNEEAKLQKQLQTFLKEIELKYQHALDEATNKLNSQSVEALMYLNTLPEQCIKGKANQIKAAQSKALKGFFSCSNTTDILRKMESLLFKTVAVSIGVSVDIFNIVTGFQDCRNIKPFKAILCLVTQITALPKEIQNIVGPVRTYIQEGGKLMSQIAEEIHDCSKTSLNLFSLQLAATINEASKCVSK